MGSFVAAREWNQFHSPKNLSMALSVEAAELMEHFLWMENDASRQVAADPKKMEEIGDEVADVANVIFCLCNALNIDLSDAIRRKMVKNGRKYPLEKSRGRYRIAD